MQEYLSQRIRNVLNSNRNDHSPQETRTMIRLTLTLTLAISAIFLASAQGATLDWDINTVSTGVQLGDGVWADGAGNWWDSSTSTNVNWNNANLDTPRFDGGNYDVTLGSDVTVASIARGYSSTNLVTLAPDAGGLYAITIDGSGITINPSRPLQIDAPVILTQNQEWRGTFDVNGAISGNASLNHNFGTLTLNGNNSFTGGFAMATTTLVIGSDTALGSGTFGWSTGGPLIAGNGPRTIANDVAAGGWNAARIFGGSNNLTVTGSYTAAAAYATGYPSLTVQEADAVVTLRDFRTNLHSGLDGFRKLGPGTLILDGTLTRSGGGAMPFAVGDGLMIWNTTPAQAVGPVTVMSGGTLGGTGNILMTSGSGVNVNAGGNLAPGGSVGTLTVNGNVDLNGALEIEIGGSGADKLFVSGLLELDSSSSVLNVVFVEGFTPTGPAAYEILDWGTLTGSFSQVNLVEPGGSFSWDDSQLLTSGILLLNIPEPASAALFALAGLALLRRRR